MIKLMTWNIKFFSDQNFADTSRSDSLSSNHIVDAVKVVDPDILVVVEVRSGGSTGVGSLITDTGGSRGVLELLNRLGAGWYVVPPQVLNANFQSPYVSTQTKYYEGIAVFFKSAQLDFIGPYVWTAAGAVPRSTVALAATAQAYAGTWANALPNTPPAGCGYLGLNQNQFAGQSFFYDTGNNQLFFPKGWGRNPFFTAFWDKTLNRVIKLFGVHLPPTYSNSKPAMKEMGKMAELNQNLVTTPAGGDTDGVVIITGDYNVNRLSPSQSDSYEEPDLDELSLATNGLEEATLIRGLNKTDPNLWKKKGWWKKDQSGNWLALDSIQYQYYGNAVNNAAGFTVLDWVQVPKPSEKPPNPNAYMSKALASIQDTTSFKAPGNYGKMRSASDHLAIAMVL